MIGPASRGHENNGIDVVLEDAFRSAVAITHTGDFLGEMGHDGFDRVIQSTDAAGNVMLTDYDPGGRTAKTTAQASKTCFDVAELTG
ncbi:MAG: hypothetical protein N2C14_17215 [Planctomycetales bacterium]